MRKTRVAINGFGRIGRTLGRLLAYANDIEWVAVNDLSGTEVLSHLFKYDSVHGPFIGEVYAAGENSLIVNNEEVLFFHEADPENLPWRDLDIDIVIEATGKFKTRGKASKHLIAGAKKVLLSAPPDDDSIKTVVLGVNDDILDGDEKIISNASCTTNSAAPMIKLIDENCEIESCYVTTIHSFTTDQSVHDQPHRDFRRARAASQSIIPTTTGAAKALTKIFPHLDNVIGGCGIRVPVPDGSLTDITFVVKEPKTIEQINALFSKAAKNEMRGIMEFTKDPIVSVDIINNPHSCIFDSLLTSVIGKMVKVVGWYDNESGYANRLVDLVRKIAVSVPFHQKQHK
jgi:glyceraldehyde 3-phosphate dehydrogenase